jgi:hypothetical protein
MCHITYFSFFASFGSAFFGLAAGFAFAFET